ncbi:PTS lactose/cellobiose transporter subunit IIA, partial [Enterococcus hirae]|nr:PTS lactose/cellobiose transporter subunit IIA [Enterococcus hirae]
GEISLLLIHAQDQLMTVMSEQALIERLIKMQKQINENN